VPAAVSAFVHWKLDRTGGPAHPDDPQWDRFLIHGRTRTGYDDSDMARSASSVAKSLARCALLAVLLASAAMTVPPVTSHAKGETKAQRQLQNILDHRRYWQTQLASEQREEQALAHQLTTTHVHLKTTKQKLAAQEAAAAAKQAALDAVIVRFQGQIASIQNQLVQTRTEYRQVHAQAARLLKALRVLRARIRRESGHVRQAIVEMYQISQISPLETVLEAKNLSQFLTQQNIVNKIGQHDAGILRWAEHEHMLVHRAASSYIQKMRDLKALQAQEQTQLELVGVETQHENLLLIQERQAASRREANIEQTEASIRALAQEERTQLQQESSTAQSTKTIIRQDEKAAERVGWIIDAQTGTFPKLGVLKHLQWPVVGPITQPFGPTPYAFEPAVTYHGVFYPHFHTGIDIAAPFNSPIRAAAAGKVIFASLFVPGQPHESYGLCVIIMHSASISTLYAHMDLGLGLQVHVGQIVAPGQIIGYEGLTGNTTGPHLHFEVRVNGIWVNPLSYLPKEPAYSY
jgi:murein DD-endopeptidase MepM/ murein hydrolase activator NlpD